MKNGALMTVLCCFITEISESTNHQDNDPINNDDDYNEKNEEPEE